MKEYNLGALQSESLRWTAHYPYMLNQPPAKTAQGSNYDTLQAHAKANGKTSLLGTPIFLPCTLKYEDEFDTLEVELQGEPMIVFRLNKTIVKTAIDSKQGSFKELYSQDDYGISIKGFLFNNEANEYPEKAVRDLRNILEKQKHLRITNALARIFGVTYIAVESAEVNCIEGAQNYIAYQVNAVSDQLFDIKLKQKK
jgi:hypothetical protein